MCCSSRNTVGFKIWDSSVPSLLHIFSHRDNCGFLLSLGKDFPQKWTNGNSRHQTNPFRSKQATLNCEVFPTTQGLDSSIILHSSVPSREAVNLGFLRYTPNHSTPDKFWDENKFVACLGGFLYALFLLPEKGRIMHLQTILNTSQVLLSMLPLDRIVCTHASMQW